MDEPCRCFDDIEKALERIVAGDGTYLTWSFKGGPGYGDGGGVINSRRCGNGVGFCFRA